MSKIKTWCLNGVIISLFIIILGLNALPSIFYFTAENLKPSNGSLPRNITTNEKWDEVNHQYPPVAVCNKPLIQYRNGNFSLCVPQCGWKPWEKHQIVAINATTFAACFLAMISLIMVLLTWFKISQLWKFPHFITVIMLGESTLIVVLVSVATLLGDDVFCSSKFLSIASKRPTTFCKFEGVVLHYLEGSIALWFVTYNVCIAKVLVFDKIQVGQSSKWSFIISALVCWLLPVIPVIIVLTSQEEYSVPFYSNYCFPGSTELFFYTAVLPENILFTIGVFFLNIVIWKLLKERNASVTASEEQARLRKTKMDDVVSRLTLLMVSYAATVYLTYGSMCYMINKAPAAETAIKSYFLCLMVQPNCPPDYKNYISHVPVLLNYVAAGLFPVSTVLFLVANEKARRLWKTSYHRLRSFISKEQGDKSSSVTHLVNEDAVDRQLVGRT